MRPSTVRGGNPLKPPQHSTENEGLSGKYRGLLAALFYGLISISITFFNKIVLSVYSFQYSNVLTLSQMIFSLVLLYLMKQSSLVNYPSFEMKTARKLIPLAFWFNAMVVTGLASLGYMNVPLWSALRRFTTFLVMMFEYTVLNKRYPKKESYSIVLMVLGASIAGITDVQFDAVGYFLVFLNCIATAMYLIYISKLKNETGINNFGLIYYNNVLSLPFVIATVWYTGEFEGARNHPSLGDGYFQISFVLSSAQAFLLNYAIFLCTTVNSPLTTSVTGQLKNVVTTFFGYLVFEDNQYTPLNIVGIVESTAASVWYGYIKYEQEMAAKKESNSKKTTTV